MNITYNSVREYREEEMRRMGSAGVAKILTEEGRDIALKLINRDLTGAEIALIIEVALKVLQAYERSVMNVLDMRERDAEKEKATEMIRAQVQNTQEAVQKAFGRRATMRGPDLPLSDVPLKNE